MANRSYLCGTNKNTIYPAFVEKRYESALQTIANDVSAIPLLWLACFREEDLVREEFNCDGEIVPAFAPVCERNKAVEQLRAALPVLNETFQPEGPLDDYVAFMSAAIEDAGFEYLTIELSEIADLYAVEHRFDDVLTLALRGFAASGDVAIECPDVEMELPEVQFTAYGSGGEKFDFDGTLSGREFAMDEMSNESEPEKILLEGFHLESHREVLEQLSSLRLGTQWPSARMYLDQLDYRETEQWNFTRLLGAGREGSLGIGREVPWESRDADYGFCLVSLEDDRDATSMVQAGLDWLARLFRRS